MPMSPSTASARYTPAAIDFARTTVGGATRSAIAPYDPLDWVAAIDIPLLKFARLAGVERAAERIFELQRDSRGEPEAEDRFLTDQLALEQGLRIGDLVATEVRMRWHRKRDGN
jgi:hypothetical protein